jgi:transcriptional accessory protein Tex/SPT6
MESAATAASGPSGSDAPQAALAQGSAANGPAGEPQVAVDLGVLAERLELPHQGVEAAVRLLDEGNTVPFIARYRKDQTGGLDEVQIRRVCGAISRARQVADRKRTILRTISGQGKLSPEITRDILAAENLKHLEDLYLPFKPRKLSLAEMARQRRLEPFASEILAADPAAADLDRRAIDFISEDAGVVTAADALLGVGHILAESFAERADLRQRIRSILHRQGHLRSTRCETEPKPAAARSNEARRKDAVAGPVAPVESAAAETLPQQPLETPSAAPAAEPAAPAVKAGLIDSEAAQMAAPAPAETGSIATTAAAPSREGGSPDGGGAEAALSAPAAEAPLPMAAPVDSAQSASSAEAGQKPHADRKKSGAERKKKDKKAGREAKQYRDYFDFSDHVQRIPPHRALAINRGERAKVLKVRIDVPLDEVQAAAEEVVLVEGHPHRAFLAGCLKDAVTRLILPSLERELRREITDYCESHAVTVFARNLRNLLLQPPVVGRRVLALDPGFKSGCKAAVLDECGNPLEHAVLHIIGQAEKRAEAAAKIVELVKAHGVTVIAVGNGTAGRATEAVVAEVVAGELAPLEIGYVVVNEAGASDYSTSTIGREELPGLDSLARGAITIGRRLQDPLSELVKIQPASIGVGLYQHDVRARHLRDSLDAVVESCVNFVGVDANTASPSLLRYVSGLNQSTARGLHAWRVANGPFTSRAQFLEVPGFGESAYVQAAGFLKIAGGSNPLDSTWIHPESYPVAERVLERLGFTVADLTTKQGIDAIAERARGLDRDALAAELGVGTHLLSDIIDQLRRPGRDPRQDLPLPFFKKGVLKLEDLEVGMELMGSVLNVVDFGAFVDIGLHDCGLVHVSRLAPRFVGDPHDVVAVGQIVRVWVADLDKGRRRVSLTMIPPGRPGGGRGRGRDAGGGAEGRGKGDAPGRRTGAVSNSGGRAIVNRERPAPEAGRGAGRPGGDRSGGEGASRHDRGGRQGRGRGGPQRSREGRVFESKRSGEAPRPLSDGMRKGREPLRTFGDLKQFLQEKSQPASGEPQGQKDADGTAGDRRRKNHRFRPGGDDASSSDPPASQEISQAAPPAPGGPHESGASDALALPSDDATGNARPGPADGPEPAIDSGVSPGEDGPDARQPASGDSLADDGHSPRDGDQQP